MTKPETPTTAAGGSPLERGVGRLVNEATGESMERHEDPSDPLNGAEHHTGKQCIERGCSRPAGTAWSPFWCQPCNSDRLRHITEVLERKLDRMTERREPPNVF